MSQQDKSTLLHFNGLNGATGQYLYEPKTVQQLSEEILGVQFDSQHQADLRLRSSQINQQHLGVMFGGGDPTKVEEVGWGVIFAATDTRVPALKEALKELLDHRRAQAGERYREFSGQDGYLADESKIDWLARHGAEVSGQVDPDKMPYYLLIVGDPESIPYRFQYQLDVQYAVGRIHFETDGEYAQYARSVVLAETGKVTFARRASFFGVRNPDDYATGLSADLLVKPLAERLVAARKNWTIETYLAERATKAQFQQLLGGAQTPALLFTASHGLAFPPGDARQVTQQGALVCQEWPGPLQWTTGKALPHDYYLTADDIGDGAHPLGMISFHFACFGAGTPRANDFPQVGGHAPELSPHAFMARLPQRLVGHPRGGALAVIGHVERAWDCSFNWKQQQQLNVYVGALMRLFAGQPVGCATEDFNNRYAELSTELSSEIDQINKGLTPQPDKLTALWTSNNDARNYIVVGDPAVRLAVSDQPQARRPA
jgi:hypothetical protein